MSRLSTRSNALELPPFDPTVGPKLLDVLRGEADHDTWRIVEAISISGRPFELELGWSSGSGSGARAQITVARSTRISVFARSVQVRAANLSTDENRVVVTVADGFAMTRNQWEHRARHLSTGISSIPVPPFADNVRVDLADPTLLFFATLRLVDGEGVVRTALPLDLQPLDGLPLGGVQTIELDLAVDLDFRAVYHLSL